MANMSFENHGLDVDKTDFNRSNDLSEMTEVIEPVIEVKKVDDVEGGKAPGSKPRTTNYDKRKNIANGMMDTALISANANQLKFIIEFNKRNAAFYVLVTLIILSLIIQLAVGVGLIFRQKKKNKNKNGEVIPPANEHPLRNLLTVDEFIIVGVFLVIVINIFVAAFSSGNGASDTKDGSKN